MLGKKSVVLLHGYFNSSMFDELAKNKIKDIYLLEGRPDFQSSKKSIKELKKRKITPTVIADNMAGFLFFKNFIKEVRLAYDCSEREGIFCQIGGLILSVLAKDKKVPVKAYPANRKTALLGKQRDIAYLNGKKVIPDGIKGYVPLIDWVPGKYLTKVY